MELDRYDDDSPAFVGLVERVLNAVDLEWGCDACHVVRIRGWFDHKWLGFAGIGRVPFYAHPDVAKDAFAYDSRKRSSRVRRLTLPPFSPKRLLDMTRWVCAGTSDSARWPHKYVRDHSSHNIHRPLSDFADHACLVWYSSGTAHADRASLMTYMTKGSRSFAPFYVGFRRFGGDGWAVSLAKGISLGDFRLLESTSGAEGLRRT